MPRIISTYGVDISTYARTYMFFMLYRGYILNVQILHVQRIILDEFAAGFDLVAH